MKILDITPKETQIVLRKDSGLVTAEALEREEETRKLIKGYISKNLKKGTDYYELQIGGRTSNPSLSKPGAEKFMSLFHLRAEFERDNDTWEMMGKKDGVLCYVCKLYTKSGQLVGEGRGARDVHKDGDINKAIKMAQKSANIDAVLRVGALSEMFTQDLEDLKENEKINNFPIIDLDSDPTIKNAKQHDDLIGLKKRIMLLINRIEMRNVKDKAEIENLIRESCQEELIPENYQSISNKLEIIWTDQQEAHKKLK